MTIFEIDNKIKTLTNKLENLIMPEISVFSRICGYHRVITAWNKGKAEEYKDRKLFKMIK